MPTASIDLEGAMEGTGLVDSSVAFLGDQPENGDGDGTWSATPSGELLKRLKGRGLRRTYAAGEVICHAGDRLESLHLIVRGCVTATGSSLGGLDLTCPVLGPEEVFGEASLLPWDADPSEVTVRALAPTDTVAIDRQRLHQLQRTDPQIAGMLVQLLADRVNRLTEQLMFARQASAEARVMRVLLELAVAVGSETGSVAIPITQADLADLAGTSRPRVSAVLKSESERGTLRCQRSRIELLDLQAIRSSLAPLGFPR